ncbi:hypothetical protein GA707_10665 [Nostocoides sp. F2B08]|uniref:hypothetical protein n=1 Tax=Nostocoides sp. F2B08 TaxID=2653936 RepID=UPI001263E07B|nr:hypothetical protein [Tetrasphaera sp. F2B08]KAB7743929.1 hypothetical protein GA707_10665 [Tetrasphaera sp. F2B08]
MPTPPRPRRLVAPVRAPVQHAGEIVGRLTRLGGRRVERDYTGWTGHEVLDDLREGDVTADPVRRAGHDVVRRINALSGSLPPEAVVLGRAITDTAPPLGDPISPAMRDLLGTYVPQSLDAYVASTRRGPHTPAQELLLTQLRLLFDVAHHIERAENEHDEQALIIQARFLRERFAEISRSNDLDVEGSTPPAPRRPVAPRPVPTRPAFEHGRSFLHPHHEPVVLVPLADGAGPSLTLRLALPRGYAARAGAVTEQPSGTTAFVQKATRRVLAPRRSTGFATAQTDLTLRVDLASERRVLLYAYGFGVRPLETTAFVTTPTGSSIELATVLLGRRGHLLTVIASGLLTPEGLVLRNEGTVWPDLRSACAAYDMRRISWLDAHTPFV